MSHTSRHVGGAGGGAACLFLCESRTSFSVCSAVILNACCARFPMCSVRRKHSFIDCFIVSAWPKSTVLDTALAAIGWAALDGEPANSALTLKPGRYMLGDFVF